MLAIKEELWRDYQHLSRCEVDNASTSSYNDSVLLRASYKGKATQDVAATETVCNEVNNVPEVGTDAAEYFSDELPELDREVRLPEIMEASSRPAIGVEAALLLYSQQVAGSTTIYTGRSTPARGHSPYHIRSREQARPAAINPVGQTHFSLGPSKPASVALREWTKYCQQRHEKQAEDIRLTQLHPEVAPCI